MNHRASRINDCTVAGLQRYSASRRFAWDAAHPQRNNTKAAARAARYLAMYVADEGGDIDSGFRGLLSDLRHLADALVARNAHAEADGAYPHAWDGQRW